ncbi:caspase family protein [Microvirga sp. STR05]|uniref:Caspase family protein n=1 Tax=Hymenobacter duratus TaxID=2771356 RepID=A0ABR8JLB6_9BACT|nr:caspase family protein [Hymenobacter duratus]MBD2716675.1 caspase family protein [Hymenobacter duratus]MBR7951590.1 caspase family protein [Microvirga sp. STR05]
MAGRFKKLTLAEFTALVNRFPFTRRINAVHMHHTWRPNHAQYQGEASIEAMWRYHTQTNGWSDIAQHVTIGKDGSIWTGRNWNQAPASASGHNGNSQLGPFMFEMVGDFDKGKDPFGGAQREAALHVVAHILHRFGLPAKALHFHREMSTKTCPGSGIDYDKTLADVKVIMAKLGRREAPILAEADGVAEGLLALLQEPDTLPPTATRSLLRMPEEGELEEETMDAREIALLTQPEGSRGLFGPPPLPAATVELLRSHVINLEQGGFSDKGEFSTTPADVDAIFGWRLEQALREAQQAGRPLQLLFYAHGGLVAERTGLDSAARYIPWWTQNHIYPIYFVWETGLMGTLGALLRGQRRRAAATRGVTDWTDTLVENAVRAPGRPIWKNMKDSAEWAATPGGGSHYVAQQLLAFCRRHTAALAEGSIRLHAVGHSAGSIFHAHFLPLAWHMGVPAFRTLHLLAPAIRVDEFRKRLAGQVGGNAGHLTLYTMRDTLERDDQCGGVYRKSLLYLLYYALESERDTPILGLDSSLRNDEEMRRLLGLNGQPNQAARVVWSQTKEASGRSSSTSTTHGGFDDDAATMESVARRVLEQDTIVPFPKPRALPDPWTEPVALPEALLLLAQEQLLQQAASAAGTVSGVAAETAAVQTPVVPLASPNGHSHNGHHANGHSTSSPDTEPAAADDKAPTNRRRALCIGIDNYPDAPLMGCVADARQWEGTLAKMGFRTQLLVNAQATRAAILERLTDLVTTSKAGDIVVVQYAGHGTQVPDQDGDERTDENQLDTQDEALCAYDYNDGGLILDDDLRDVFRLIPDGVNVTCFMDCCHSESNTRKAVFGRQPANARKRYMRLPDKARQNFLSKHPKAAARSRAATGKPEGGRELLRAVNFTACKATEYAYEVNGQGLFTSIALPLLQTPAESRTHRQFMSQIEAAFANVGYEQHPTIDCTDEAQNFLLLQALRPEHA